MRKPTKPPSGCEDHQMTTRNLSQRLKRLEARTAPASQAPMLMTIDFIGPDRQVKSSLVIKVFACVRKKQYKQ
jgi:hypothetical protein